MIKYFILIIFKYRKVFLWIIYESRNIYIIIFESFEACRNPRGIPQNPRIYDIISTAMIATAM